MFLGRSPVRLAMSKWHILQMAQWGTWQLHLRQQLPHFAEFCNILLYILYTFTVSRGLEKKRFFAILDFQDTVFLAQF